LTKNNQKDNDQDGSEFNDSILTPTSLRMKIKELDFSPDNTKNDGLSSIGSA
jgi:hypothetical protein